MLPSAIERQVRNQDEDGTSSQLYPSTRSPFSRSEQLPFIEPLLHFWLSQQIVSSLILFGFFHLFEINMAVSQMLSCCWSVHLDGTTASSSVRLSIGGWRALAPVALSIIRGGMSGSSIAFAELELWLLCTRRTRGAVSTFDRRCHCPTTMQASLQVIRKHKNTGADSCIALSQANSACSPLRRSSPRTSRMVRSKT